MITCPSCGTINRDENSQCISCHSPLVPLCAHCMYHNSVANGVCIQCGQALDQTEFSDIKAISNPFDAMYSVTAPINNNRRNLKSAVLKLLFGIAAVMVTMFTPLLKAQPIWRFIIITLGGSIFVWGIIEIVFWLIDESGSRKASETDFTDAVFPEHKPSTSDLHVESFETSDLFVPQEEVKTDSSDTEEDPSKDSQPDFESPSPNELGSLSEFLTEGIENEITETSEALKKAPGNYSLLLKLSRLYEEKGDLNKSIECISKCLKNDFTTAETWLYYGTLQRRVGKDKEAEKAFLQSLEMNAFMSKTFYQLGVLYKSQCRLPEARAMLQRSIILSPDDPYAHYQLGTVYSNAHDYKSAINEIKRAVMLHPTDSYGHSKLGQLYQKTKQYNLAVAAYSKALSIKSKDSYVIEHLAEVLFLQGKYLQSEELFQKAIKYQENASVSTMLSYGQVIRKLEKYDLLKNLAEEILEKEKDNSSARLLLAISLTKLGESNKAEILLEKLSEEKNTDYEVWVELGKIYKDRGESMKAVNAFVKATATAPDQAKILNGIGILLADQKAYNEAVKAFRKALSLDYTDKVTAENLARVKDLLIKESKNIIKTEKQKLTKDPNDLEAYIKMGKAYERTENPAKAADCYKLLLAKDPHHVPGLMAYAELLRKCGNLKKAVRCYKEIIKIDPQNAATHLFLVQANLNLGFINDALQHATIASKLAPNDPKVHFLQGEIFLAKGIAPRALKEFTEAASSPEADTDMVTWAELMRQRLLR